MGLRGELFSTRVILQNRTYFFNVKENRLGDLYLNIVESKNRDEGGFDRQSVILFADDLQEFLKGFDESLRILEKETRERRRSARTSAQESGTGDRAGGYAESRTGARSGRTGGYAESRTEARSGGGRAGSKSNGRSGGHAGNRADGRIGGKGGGRVSGRIGGHADARGGSHADGRSDKQRDGRPHPKGRRVVVKKK